MTYTTNLISKNAVKKNPKNQWYTQSDPVRRSLNSFNPIRAAIGSRLISYPKPPYANPHLNVKVPFGRHKGKTLGEILYEDASYLAWLAENFVSKRPNDPLDAALKSRDWQFYRYI